jgi:phosphoketolase
MPIPEDSPAKGQAALDSLEWQQLDAYWRAANYLSVGQIYLYANPLLREWRMSNRWWSAIGERLQGRISSTSI